MFKYHLIIFVLWCEIRGQDVHDQTDTKIVLPPASLPCPSASLLRSRETEEPSNRSVTMNGHSNINNIIGQQIFYVYDNQFFKRILSNLPDNSFVTSDSTSTHKFYSYKLNWYQARQTCVQEGGHLAIINSDSEEKLLLRILQEKNVDTAWLGLHDLYEEGNWVTVMDQALKDTGFIKWTNKWENQPDNAGGNQNCALLIKDGGMDDFECKSVHHFFCEFS